MRLNNPQLPTAPASDKWAADVTAALTKTLLAIVTELNNLSDGRIVAHTTAAPSPPTQGQFAQGDFIRNSKPTASGVFGWVCVTNGVPGVWKAVVIAA
jgi:hypothetical protein